MTENLMTVVTFVVSILTIIIATYGAIALKRLRDWSDAKLAAEGIKLEQKWQDDLKAGLLTGAKAALLEGASIDEAILAAIRHTLLSNSEAASGLKPTKEVLDNLAKAAVADARMQIDVAS